MLTVTRWSTLLAVLVLAGCKTPEPVVPPMPLQPIENSIQSRVLWTSTLGELGESHEIRRTRLVPYTDDDVIFAASAQGQVSAIDRQSGQSLWRRSLQRAVSGGIVADENHLYVSDRHGAVIALSRVDGKQSWQHQMTSEVLAPVAAGFDVVVARSNDGRVTGLRASDGSELWSNIYTPPPLTVNGYAAPTLVQGGVLVGLDDGTVVALASDNGRQLWDTVVSYAAGRSEVERLVDVDAGVLTDDDSIYAASYQGLLAKIEPVNGRRMWTTEISATADLDQQPERVHITDEFDRVFAIAKSDGSTLWQQDNLSGRTLSSPASTDSVVVVGDFEGYLHVLSQRDGNFLARVRAGKSPIVYLTALDEAEFLVLSADGRLRLIQIGL